MMNFKNAEGFGTVLTDGSPRWIPFGPLLAQHLPEMRQMLSAANQFTRGRVTEEIVELRFSKRAIDAFELTWFGEVVTEGSVPRRWTAWRAAANVR